MAEDIETGAEAGSVPPSDGAPGAAAVALALGEAGRDPGIAEDARAFLRKQSRYLELQMEDLHEQRALTLSHLKWRRFSDWMHAGWIASLALLAVSAVIVLATAMWTAHEANGLVVRALKTPPDFAAKGLDGTVLAQRLLDKLNGLVAESEPVAFRSAAGIRGDWGEDSKVEIPDTGVSVAELSRFLRAWLGRETHVSGEVWPTQTGIAVTVRADNDASVTVTGAPADLDKLLDRAAEKILAETQPYRYAAVLDQRGHYAQAADFLRPIARGGAPEDRAWAYTFWSNTLAFAGDNRGAIALANIALRYDASDPAAYFSRLSGEANLAQSEATLKDLRALDRLMANGTPRNLSATAAGAIRPIIPQGLCALAGDFLCAANAARVLSDQNFDGFEYGDLEVAYNYARAHDGAAARALLAAHPQWNDGTAVLASSYIGDMMPRFALYAGAGQWKEAAADASAGDRAAQAVPGLADTRRTFVWPWLALALAKSGDAKSAQALIATTPLDCTPCLEMRGLIAETEGDDARAALWFDRAAKDAPSIPFANTDWGGMLLAKGDFDGAIAKFRSANAKGPHFADPLEMWGEALVAKNRSGLALAKFSEAVQYAPAWGRLHLKWGEALWWSGDKTGAAKQFAIASGLDMNSSEKAELAKARHG